RKFQITDIARLFRVPPHMIADLDRATFSNIEQQSLEFVMHTMTPWAERWEASIESELLLDGDDLEIEFDFSNLMRGDAASRSAYYQSGIQNGWLTRNEARIAENLNPIDGLDEPLRPLNMVEESDAEDLTADAEAQEAPAQEASEPPDDETAARLQALITSTAERWARRISRAGRIEEKDVDLIAEAFAVPPERVAAWAAGSKDAELTEVGLCQSLTQLGMNTEGMNP
ncbi:MAG: phage portal protein, partial [Actinobacteria bacterium]|nr:phage portal protein [Actinomycetota bacterium]